MHIGFIGLGVMGAPMAANLLAAGQSLSVYDLDPTRSEPLQGLGARVARCPGDAASGADIVMSSLPGPAQVHNVAFGDDGVLNSMRSGATWVELSTSNLAEARRISAAASERRVNLLDAPVSGGDEGARAGSLTILVGGKQDIFERCLPVLRIIGERIEYLGPAGAGYAAKIAQVVLCYVHSLALSEALMLGVRGGVDAARMLSVIQNSTGTSYAAERYGPPIIDGDYDASFTLALALKDMRLAAELADSLGAQLPLCELVTQTYARACETFGGDANHLMAVRLLEDAHATLLRPDSSSPHSSEDLTV